MNFNQQFDEYIKEQFNDYSPDVQPRIWKNIVATQGKRKPAGFWFTLFNNKNNLILLGLLIVISIGGAWFYFNNNTIPVKTQKLAENNKPKDQSKASNSNPSGSEVSAALLNTDNSTAINTTSTNASLTLITPKKTLTTIFAASLQSDETDAAKTGGSNKKDYFQSGKLSITTNTPGLIEDDFTVQGTLLGRLTFNAEKYSALLKTRTQKQLTFIPVIFLPGCPSFEKNTAGNKKYLEFYVGPDFAIRSLRDTGNSVYLQKRKESTSFKSAFSAGIRYTKVFNNSMSIRGGINYSQINEKFTFVQGNLVQVTYIIDANGDTTGSYTTTGTRYKTTINKYRSIDVPIVIGYEVGNGKLHANINAGVVTNIYSWQIGDVLDTALRPVNITTGKSSSPYQFKTNVGFGFIAGVSVYYKLNDKLHLMAEPYFRYNFSPLNKESITLKQKYETVGLRLGIRLDLK